MTLEDKLAQNQTKEYNTEQADYIRRLYFEHKQDNPQCTMTEYILNVYLHPAYGHETLFRYYWKLKQGEQ
jgi:hypothetical protein